MNDVNISVPALLSRRKAFFALFSSVPGLQGFAAIEPSPAESGPWDDPDESVRSIVTRMAAGDFRGLNVGTVSDCKDVLQEIAEVLLKLDANNEGLRQRLREPSCLERIYELQIDALKNRLAGLEKQLSPAQPQRAIEAALNADVIGVVSGMRVL